MAKTRRYHPLVADELATAVKYYDDISIALGSRFRAAVRDRIEAVTDRPESFGRIHERYRAAMLDQFPYVVVFELQNQAVEYWACSMPRRIKASGLSGLDSVSKGPSVRHLPSTCLPRWWE